MNVNVGIDIGSTTVKIVVVRDGEIIHKHYERHFSKVAFFLLSPFSR